MNLPEKYDPPGKLSIVPGLDKQTLGRFSRLPLAVRMGYRCWISTLIKLMDKVRSPASVQGVEDVGKSWAIDDGSSLQHIMKACGGDPCKRYRIDEKVL